MQKKILYIVEADLTSGSGKCLWELVQLIKKETDYKPIIITQYQNNLNKTCNLANIENYSIHYARTCSLGMGWLGWTIAFLSRPFLNFISYYKLKKKLDFKSICIVHSNSSSIDFGAYLQKKLHIPHIWHVREFLVFDHFWKPIIYNLPKYIANNSSYTIAVSNSLRNYLQKKTKKINIQTIYDGFTQNISRGPQKNTNTSKKLRLVCVGNIAAIKGQDVLLEAICLLPKEVFCNVLVDFFGNLDAKYKIKINQIVNENSLDGVVNFHAFSNNIFDILSDYDIGVQPSHTEGFSRVTVEYMLSGLCVIGNGDTAIHELIEHRKTGLLYKDYDVQKLADYISFCYYNRDIVKKMGEKAQKEALQKYCTENSFQKICAIYNQVIERQC